jgi:iron complex outermembrane receptor protein
MNAKCIIVLSSFCLAVSVASVHAAQPAGGTSTAAPSTLSTGTITGRVKNLVTGRYLNNARVVVKQTDIVVMTDEAGGYQITNAPAGAIVLEVFYTGLDVQQIPLTLTPGQTLQRDVDLANSALFGGRPDIVNLDPFVVASSKETDGAAIAINEQRFAPNIKSVVSTDTFGDVVGGNNLADFLKFIPGVQTSSGQFEAESVNVRGFPAAMTVVTSDGAATASTGVSGDSRAFTLQGVSINNFSRVEVTKVPTPSTGADTMAGSINMISKNAFERSTPDFRYQVNLTGNSHHLTLKPTPWTDGSDTYKINPGFSFSYLLPVSNRFGVVVSAAHSNTFHSQNLMDSTFSTSGTGTGASISKPYLSTWQLTDGPMYRYRNSMSFRADWRVTTHSVLSVGAVTNLSRLNWSNEILSFNTGTTGTSTVAGGVPFSYAENNTIGATGRGSVQYRNTFMRRSEANSGGNIRYGFDNGDWKIDLLGSMSTTRAWFRTLDRGAFGSVTASTKNPVRVSFLDIDPYYGPRRIQVFDNSNREIDPYDPNNFNLTAVSADRRDVRDKMETGNVDIKRRINVLPFPASVQVGARTKTQTRDKILPAQSYTYQGPNGDQSSAPYVDQVYANQKHKFNNVDRGVPNISAVRALQAWQANPSLFTMTPVQLVDAERTRITTSEYIQETVSAYYLQTDARLFNNRLYVLTGVRYEKTEDDGRGALQDAAAVFVRNANGTFAHTAAGARIRKPEAGAVGSMEETRLIYKERAYVANRSYDGYYPSLHLTYNVRENFLARLAYAKTYGRPNYSDIIPNAVTSENDVDVLANPTAVLGTINVRNTGLQPWSANNYDLSLEYYTNRGGLFSASLFYKDIKDFFGTFAKVATAADLDVIGLDDRYVGWMVTSRINTGDASVTGGEISMNHSLRQLGGWAQYFDVFASATKMRLKGGQQADFQGFVPESANWGVTFNRKPVMLMAKWSYRSDEKRGPYAAFGPDAFTVYTGRTELDMNLSYSLRPNLVLFLNARNVLNLYSERRREGSQTPHYAKQTQVVDNGAPFSIGIKGSF